MASFALFLLLLFLLFLFSQLIHKDISRVLFRLTHNKKLTIYIMAFLFFPGTLIHELAHFLMAHLLFVPTGTVSLLPKITGDHVTLGSVEIAKRDPLRRLLIGAAPFLLGTTLLLLSLFFAEKYNIWGELSYTLLVIYLLFELGNTMFSSRKDMEGALSIIIFCLILGVTLQLLGFQLLAAFKALLADDGLNALFQKGSLYLLYPLGVNLILLLLLRLPSLMRR